GVLGDGVQVVVPDRPRDGGEDWPKGSLPLGGLGAIGLGLRVTPAAGTLAAGGGLAGLLGSDLEVRGLLFAGSGFAHWGTSCTPTPWRGPGDLADPAAARRPDSSGGRSLRGTVAGCG